MERGRRIGRGAVSHTVAASARRLDIFSSSFFCISGQLRSAVGPLELRTGSILLLSTDNRPVRLISAAALGR